jgi:L-alanine-DL-glutamate epimerase-like enolase superfamily enzyme
MVVALWDIVAKAANLAQLLGLDAVTLITIAISFLRFHQARKECRKLEERERMLRALLSSVGGRWITQRQQQDELLQMTLRDANSLVESYKRRSLYARVRGGRGMATRFRDLRSRVDSYCHLILAVNAFLLVVQPPNHPSPSLAIRSVYVCVSSETMFAPSSARCLHGHNYCVLD